jgi:Leucine-rich repeat (LRR) protein
MAARSLGGTVSRRHRPPLRVFLPSAAEYQVDDFAPVTTLDEFRDVLREIEAVSGSKVSFIANADGLPTSLTIDGGGRLPDSICRLVTLVALHVNNTRIRHLPSSIGHLRNLRTLDVSHNDLVDLPDSIGRLAQLTNFSATHNRLTKLPASMQQLRKLTRLQFQENRLTDLPSLEQSESLSLVNVRNNNMSAIPDWLPSMPKLIMFDVSGNDMVHRDRVGRFATSSEIRGLYSLSR